MIGLGIKVYDELAQKNRLQQFLAIVGLPIGLMVIYFSINLISANGTNHWLLLAGFVNSAAGLLEHEIFVYSDETNLSLELACLILIWIVLMIVSYLKSPRIEERKAVCLRQKDAKYPLKLLVPFRMLARWSLWFLLTMLLVGFFYLGQFFSLRAIAPSILVPVLVLVSFFWILYGWLYFFDISQVIMKMNWCHWLLEDMETAALLIQEVETKGYLKIQAEEVPLGLQRLVTLDIVTENKFLQAHLPAQEYVYLTVSKDLLTLSRNSDEWETVGLWIED